MVFSAHVLPVIFSQDNSLRNRIRPTVISYTIRVYSYPTDQPNPDSELYPLPYSRLRLPYPRLSPHLFGLDQGASGV